MRRSGVAFALAVVLAACSGGGDNDGAVPAIEDPTGAAAAAAAAAGGGTGGSEGASESETTGTTGGSTAGTTTGTGTSSGSTTGSTATSGSSGGGTAGATASTGGSASSGSTSGSTTGSTTGSTSGSIDDSLPPIQVGAFVTANRGAFLAAFGVNGGEELDTQAVQDALVASINAGNGFGGHRVEVVYHEVDATSTESYSTLAEQACLDFTEDHDVVAVAGANTLMADCLATHGAIGVDNSDNIGGPAFMGGVRDFYYSSSSLNYDRKAAAWLDGLDETGYFEDGIYGLIHYDVDGMPSSVDDVIVPGLASRGITLAASVEVHFPDSTAGAGNTVAAIQNAVLTMQTRNVDHVLIYDVNATMPVFFMQQAQGQGYEPRYAVESDSHLNFMLTNVPESQLPGSVAVGWRPIDDQLQYLGEDGEAGRCLAILAAAGITTPDHATREAAINTCDWWFFLDHVYDRAGGLVSPAQLSATVDAMGSTYRSARTYATVYGPGRQHDGTSQVQPLRYDEGCSCYLPVGGLIRLP